MELDLEEHWEEIDTGFADDLFMPVPPRRASVEEDCDEGWNTYPTRQGERFIEFYAGNAGKEL